MIPYSKLNSQGNDFIFVAYDDSKPQLTIDQIKHYSKRDVIGCDQFFIINTSDINNIYCEVINQDGSRACQCGNGLRAAMLFLNKKYKSKTANLIVCDSTYKAKIKGDIIHVDMGSPVYIDRLPEIDKEKFHVSKRGLVITLIDLTTKLEFSFIPLSIGNNHCVVFSDGCDKHKDNISNILNHLYNGDMNVGFVCNAEDFFLDDTTIVDLLVNERGAGYTQSCGSGATAAAICLFKLFELRFESKVKKSLIKIKQRGGILEVIKSYNPDEFTLCGPSSYDEDGILD